MTLLSERIRWVMQRFDLSQAEMARICDVKQPSVNRWVSGATEKIKSDSALRLCERYPINIQWLISGIGSPLSSDAEKNRLAPSFPVAVAVFQLSAQTDPQQQPKLVEMQTPPKYYDQRWLTEHSLKSENLKVLAVPDNAMSPLLNEGDFATIDTSITSVENDRVFCFVFMGILYIRRLRLLMNGDIQAVANGSWPSEAIPKDMSACLHVLGKVVDRSGTSGL